MAKTSRRSPMQILASQSAPKVASKNERVVPAVQFIADFTTRSLLSERTNGILLALNRDE